MPALMSFKRMAWAAEAWAAEAWAAEAWAAEAWAAEAWAAEAWAAEAWAAEAWAAEAWAAEAGCELTSEPGLPTIYGNLPEFVLLLANWPAERHIVWHESDGILHVLFLRLGKSALGKTWW